MPYIKKNRQAELEKGLGSVIMADPSELSYAVCKLFMKFVDDNLDGQLSYRHLNSALGALNEAVAEIRRRLVVPYARAKILENGDVFQDFVRRHNLREV